MARLRAPRGYVPTAVELHRDPRVSEAACNGSRSSRHASRLSRWGWLRVPVALEGARWQPGRSAVLGVVVVTLLAVAVFGLRVAWATSDDGGRVVAPGGGSRAGPTGVTAGAAPVGGTADATARGIAGTGGEETSGAGMVTRGGAPTVTGTPGAAVVVHVVGQVRRPGVLRLAAGSRVADALDAAGGPTPTADLARVNLARVLVDGEQVQVPAPGDPDPVGVGVVAAGPAAPGRGVAAGDGGTAGVLVPLNTADLATLETLPGVGPVLAQRIVDWRSQHGRFTSVEELGEVSGIGEKLLAQLTPLVTL